MTTTRPIGTSRTPREQLGYTHGLKGLDSHASDSEYLRGWFAGNKRRNRGKASNTASQRRAAEKTLKEQYRCRTNRTARRCPECGTPNLVRTKDNVCLVCCMKARVA